MVLLQACHMESVELNLEKHRFVVKWSSLDNPFATSGDSGSLVSATKEGKIMPIGLHIGSREERSFGVPLYSVATDISENLDADLLFFMSHECGQKFCLLD